MAAGNRAILTDPATKTGRRKANSALVRPLSSPLFVSPSIPRFSIVIFQRAGGTLRGRDVLLPSPRGMIHLTKTDDSPWATAALGRLC